MDKVSLILGLSNLLSGLLILGLLWPLYREKVGRNGLYGVRTKKTLAGDEVWYPVNKYAAQQMLPWAAAIAGLGAAAFFIPLENHPSLALLIGLAPLGIIVPCIQTARYCKQFDLPAAKRKRPKR